MNFSSFRPFEYEDWGSNTKFLTVNKYSMSQAHKLHEYL